LGKKLFDIKKEKQRTIKAYFKLGVERHLSAPLIQIYIFKVQSLPLRELLILKICTGMEMIVKADYFLKKEFQVNLKVYATKLSQGPIDCKTKQYLFMTNMEIASIEKWRLWTPEDAPLTINYKSMSQWYKTIAFKQ